jgi:TonB dependent receptor
MHLQCELDLSSWICTLNLTERGNRHIGFCVLQIGLVQDIERLGRSDMFATIDNTVTLPGYLRALYISLTESVRLQGNLENLFNKRYFANADSNTNISPGSPRAFRVGLTTRF